jgi:hypothetical protein
MSIWLPRTLIKPLSSSTAGMATSEIWNGAKRRSKDAG